MKKIILMLLIAVFCTRIIGQGNNHKEIPQNVVAAFSSKYPSAMIKKWKADSDDYIAKFFLGKKESFAFYSPDANWIKTETKIQWTWKLPHIVKEALNKSEYASWYVNEMKEVEMPGGLEYSVHVNNGNLMDADHQQFKDDVMIFFSANGELIRKEKLP